MRGWRKKGAHRQGLGRSRGGFSTKLLADTNADCWPLGLPITRGEIHDAKVAVNLTDSVPQRPLARLGTIATTPMTSATQIGLVASSR